MTPQELALDLEQNARLPAGNLDRFNGYGGMGLPFASGHVFGRQMVIGMTNSGS